MKVGRVSRVIARFDVRCRNTGSPADMLSASPVCFILVQRVPNPLGAQTREVMFRSLLLTRCFNSQTRSAARSKAFSAGEVPAAGVAETTLLHHYRCPSVFYLRRSICSADAFSRWRGDG